MVLDVDSHMGTLLERITTDDDRELAEISKIVEALQNAVHTVSRDITQVVGNQQAFTQAMGETREAVRSMADAIARQCEEVRAYTSASSKALDERLAVMGDHAKALQTFQENLQALATNFQQALEDYHTRSKEVLSKMVQDVLDKMLAEFKASFTTMFTDINQHYRAEVVSHVQDSHKAFNDALAQLMSDLQKLAEQYQQGLQHLFGDQKLALQTFSDMVVDVHNNIGPLFEQLATSGNGRVNAYPPR
jgi:chromosome segregation ATPase